ncbi:hypothetical protein FYJ76_05320 [Ruthenibacterium lactatiformans]|uniref:Uncharacterized protein n=1 Tax=Ruthenibacterium lactatiformans TaxID=1550024 RepID=A0A6I2U7K2_9FIRM|nr:hypothetical protein [Ruthenibacterium lactatiformans]MST91361.1 hypothetical protein [Ruthenibacterium lactatiformans]
MAFHPFCAAGALIVSYGCFNFTENLLVDLTDRRAQGTNRSGRIEIENTQKVLMFKIVSRFQLTARQEGVGDTDRCGVPKCRSDVEIIILFEKRIINDADDVPCIGIPILTCQSGSDLFKLRHKAVFTGNIVGTFQGRRYRIGIFLPVVPAPHGDRVFPASGVGHIKDVPQAWIVAAGVDQGNSFGATAHIAPHAVIPEVVFRTGNGIGTLGIDHELFIERILVEPCRRLQKAGPASIAAGDLPRGVIGHLRIELKFAWHV